MPSLPELTKADRAEHKLIFLDIAEDLPLPYNLENGEAFLQPVPWLYLADWS